MLGHHQRPHLGFPPNLQKNAIVAPFIHTHRGGGVEFSTRVWLPNQFRRKFSIVNPFREAQRVIDVPPTAPAAAPPAPAPSCLVNVYSSGLPCPEPCEGIVIPAGGSPFPSLAGLVPGVVTPDILGGSFGS